MKKRFTPRAPIAKNMQCQCGNSLKLINRRNFTHGRKSDATYSAIYRCSGCNMQKRASKAPQFRKLI